MKELDVLLERFMETDYDHLDAGQHAEFVSLLQHEDPDLWMLIMERMPPESEGQARLLASIRQLQHPAGS